MNLVKRNINGNSYVGAFSASSEELTLISNSTSQKGESIIREALCTQTLRITVNSSGLVGIYIALNSKGILLPEIAFSGEIEALAGLKGRIQVGTIKGDMNALGNNVLANDKVAIINPKFQKPACNAIADILDVEVIKMSIGGYDTVGANNILTNNGIVLNNSASDDEIEAAKGIAGNVSQSTANLGSGFIGLASIANTKGLIVGEDTTGFELARMEEGLSR